MILLGSIRNDPSKWYYWGRWNQVVLFTSPWFRVQETSVVKSIGMAPLKGHLKVLHGHYYLLQNDVQKIFELASDKLMNDPKWFDNFFAVCDKRTKDLLRFKDGKDLKSFLLELQDFCGCSMLVELFDFGISKYLQGVCDKEGLSFSEIAQNIRPSRDTLLMKYRNELSQLDLKNSRAMDDFVKRYAWVGTHSFEGEPLTRAKLLEEKKQLDKSSNEKIKKQKAPEKFKEVIRIVSELAFQRSNLMETIAMVSFTYWDMIKEAGEKKGLAYDKMVSMTYDELITFLKNGKIPFGLKERKKEFGMVSISDSQTEILVGEALRKEQRIHEQKIDVNITELRGVSACKGRVIGKAKIVNGAEDVSKVKEGDILVAPETTPDYITAMGRAAGFVTEIGGLTCHAAIISREMNKPCVIGTKIATKVFHDGDLIEVDADSGIIRKIDSSADDKVFSECINNIRSKDWYKQGGDIIYFFISGPYMSVYHEWGRSSAIIIQDKANNVAYFDKAVELAKAKNLLAKYIDDPMFLKKRIKQWSLLVKKNHSLLKNLICWKDDFRKKMTDYINNNIATWRLSIIIELYDPWWQYFVGEYVSKYNLTAEEVAILTSPREYSYTQKQIIDLSKIVLSGKKQLIKSHHAKYYWYQASWQSADIISPDHFNRLFDKYSNDKKGISAEVAQIKSHLKETNAARAGIIRTRKISSHDARIFDFFSELADWRDLRKKEMVCKTNYGLMELMRLIAKENNVLLEQVSCALPSELESTKLSDDYIAVLKRRFSSPFVITNYTGYLPVTFYGQQAANIIKELESKTIGNIESVKGTAAYSGKVKGPAKIINNINDFEKMNSGDILISIMTRPELMPAMKKAKAIVTDEGGLTCHAAIISRELRIPCIVGTQTATQVFKDGDFIEVDADNGTVKKIQSDSSASKSSEVDVDAAALFVKDMKGQVTMKQEGNFSGLAFESIIPGLFPPYSSRYYDFDFRSLITVLKPHYGAVFFDKGIYQKTTNATYKHLQQKGSAEKLLEMKDFNLIEKEIKADYMRYSPKRLASLADAQLDSLMRKFFIRMYRFIACTVFSESLDAAMIRRYYDAISKEGKGFDDFLRMTTKICEESFAARYDRLLIDAKMSDYNRQWIFTDYYEAQDISRIKGITDERIKSLGGKAKIKAELSKAKRELGKNRSELAAFTKKLDKKLRLLAGFIQLCISLRDMRKEAVQKNITLLSNTAREILKRRKIGSEKVPFVFESDFMTERHKEKDYADELERRHDGCALYFNRKGLVIQYRGFDETKKRLFALVDKDSISSDELIGQSACKGKVRAKVSIVLGEKDFAKFKAGEILVTSMTRPEYMPLMKKAAGVITDEGGVTCHAAIVSRELGLPCVIGTDNATRVLKDGDEVELDADAGVVKKIISEEVRMNNGKNDEEWIFSWSMAPVMYSYMASATAVRDSKYFKGKSIFDYYDGQVVSAYMPKSQIEDFKGYGKHYLDRKFFAGYRKEYFKERADWWRWIRTIEKKDYSEVGVDELIKDNNQFMLFMRDSISYFGSTRTEMTFAAEQKLIAILQKRYEDKWIDEFTLFVSPTELDDIQKEHLDWLKLLGKGKPSDEELSAHASSYPWLFYGEFSEQNALKFLREREKTESANYHDEASRLSKDKSELKKRQSDELKKFGKEKDEIKYLANFLQTQAVERMNIKSYWGGCYYLARNLWKALSRATDIVLVDIFNFVTCEEVNQLLAKKYAGDIHGLISDRRKSFAIVYDGGSEVRVIGSQEADRLFDERIKKHQGGLVLKIRGQTASPGHYKGRVRKVIIGDLEMLKESMRDFEKGEVLVTSMTQPNMMVIAKKAGAIIADEGGITSHAAIISRELKIPCLVGCLNAMQALDDGDIIEIDASGSSGVVRIMGKNKTKNKTNKNENKKAISKTAPKKAAIIQTELKGTVINKGLVFGRARIVKTASDLKKVKTGDVLVTKMTAPKFRKAMENAIAIVTDEGDASCHAADVSREMSKPCIISTVIATKAFKDGDCLEVDANKGVVRKITAAEFEKRIKAFEKEEKIIEVSKIPIETEELEIRPDLIAWFKELSKKDLPLVGGKGANLGEMFNHFPIPNGFCITVNAYKKFLKDNKLEEGIFSLLRKLDIEDTKLLDEASVKIEKMIMAGKISGEIEEEIIRDYRALGSGFVAVRSSATAEDLPTASFAGQQATFLNVKGEKDILVAVKQCWASLFTARAIYYRVINEFHHEKVLISVVIQEMVDSDKAGVMFTANPVNNNRDEMIIEGSFGLGESVVSGQVTPDTYIIDKSPLKMQSKAVNEKRMAIIKDEKTGKNKEIALDSVKANTQCLKDSEIIDLAKVGMLIEQHYAKPQDIEWAVDRKGKIFILQSRPITTLV
ncbi:MAG: PEP-utilizing enzyme [archaeon]